MQLTHTVEEIMTKGTLLTCNPDTSIDDGAFICLLRMTIAYKGIWLERVMYQIYVRMV